MQLDGATGKAKPKSNCAVILIMDVTRLAQTRPDVGRRPRRGADADDDATEEEAAPAAPTDLYEMLGYRGPKGTVTTQQWLAIRCLSF